MRGERHVGGTSHAEPRADSAYRAHRVHRPFGHPGGFLDELKAGVHRLVDFIDAHEPQLLTYGFYIDDEAARMTVVAVHPDSASLEFHLAIGAAEFSRRRTS